MGCTLDSNGRFNSVLRQAEDLNDLGRLNKTQLTVLKQQVSSFTTQLHRCLFDCKGCSSEHQERRIGRNCSFILGIMKKIEEFHSNKEGGRKTCQAEVA